MSGGKVTPRGGVGRGCNPRCPFCPWDDAQPWPHLCAPRRGLPSQAFEYIRYNKGIMEEDSYPYEGKVTPTSRACPASDHAPSLPAHLPVQGHASTAPAWSRCPATATLWSIRTMTTQTHAPLGPHPRCPRPADHARGPFHHPTSAHPPPKLGLRQRSAVQPLRERGASHAP